ncbi:hypothetical protein CCS92_34310, partial [Methylobacterium radiotolerans]
MYRTCDSHDSTLATVHSSPTRRTSDRLRTRAPDEGRRGPRGSAGRSPGDRRGRAHHRGDRAQGQHRGSRPRRGVCGPDP